MEIRIIGTKKELKKAQELIEKAYEKEEVEVSHPYPCRGDKTRSRIYINVK